MRRSLVTLCALGVVLSGCSDHANEPEPNALVEGLGDTCCASSFGTLDQNKAPDVLQALRNAAESEFNEKVSCKIEVALRRQRRKFR